MVLAHFRKENGLSLRDVAERMGCSHTAVNKLEKASNPGIRTLKRYSLAIGVPLSSIVDGFENMLEKSLQSP